MSEIAREVEGMAGRGIEEGDGSSMMWRLVWVKQSIVVCNMASGRFVRVSEVERGVGNAVTGFVCTETPVVVVKAMGKGIPGGYTGRGTAGTGRDTVFCTRCRTRTLTRKTRTRHTGLPYK